MAASPRKTPQPPLRIAVDTGGTFTDCVWVSRGKLRMAKVFSTPADPSEAILQALSRNRCAGELAAAARHHRGHQHAAATPRRARGLRHHRRFRGHDRNRPPEPSQALRSDVRARAAAGGTQRCDSACPNALGRMASCCTSRRAKTCACSPATFTAAAPKRLPSPRCSRSPIRRTSKPSGACWKSLGLPLSLSHVILPEFREYERASTVVVNAYLQPVMQGYLQRLDSRLRQSRGQGKLRRVSS